MSPESWKRIRRGTGRVHLPASTVHRVLVRQGLSRLNHTDRPTGEVIRRDKRDRPGGLIHVNVKKFGLIPPGAAGRSTTGLRRSPVARDAKVSDAGSGKHEEQLIRLRIRALQDR